MRFYEKDELNIPRRYKKMSLKQLRIEGKVLEKFSVFVSKIMPSSKKYKKNNMDIKFYI